MNYSETPQHPTLLEGYRNTLSAYAIQQPEMEQVHSIVAGTDAANDYAKPNARDAEYASFTLRMNRGHGKEAKDGKMVPAPEDKQWEDRVAETFGTTVNGQGWQTFCRNAGSVGTLPATIGAEFMDRLQNKDAKANGALLRVVMGNGFTMLTMRLPSKRNDGERPCPNCLSVLVPDARAEQLWQACHDHTRAATQELAAVIDQSFAQLLKLPERIHLAASTLRMPVAAAVQTGGTKKWLQSLFGG